jgi:hypothetical protein
MIALKCSRCVLCRSAALLGVLMLGMAGYSQQAAESPTPPGTPEIIQPKAPEKKDDVDHRILGVLPNYRTANPLAVYEPLTTRQKFSIAVKDSFDWPNFLVSGAFAGLYQLENENPSFGQGVRGYVHRYWTAFIDQSMGNILTEAVMPALLHEDPRYFRKVTGSFWSRTGYALTRVVVTRTDSGGRRFNFSEVIGNGMMASLGNAYYVDARGWGETTQRWALQITTDAASNVLKEFWPDIKRWLRRHKNEGAAAGN